MTIQRVMFLGAHPDDETIMAGGILAMLHERGIETYVVCATDGRGGEAGGVAEADTPEGLARVREYELRCAAQALGVTSLIQLGYEDPVMGPGNELFGFIEDGNILTTRIAALIQQIEIDVVLSHGSSGEYGHPAHVQMHQAVKRAVQDYAPETIFYSIGALVPEIEDRLWNQNDPAHLMLDISPWGEMKIAAMMCHQTQHALFMRRRKLTQVRDALRVIEPVHRQWPVVAAGSAPDDPFAELLLAVGAQRCYPPSPL